MSDHGNSEELRRLVWSQTRYPIAKGDIDKIVSAILGWHTTTLGQSQLIPVRLAWSGGEPLLSNVVNVGRSKLLNKAINLGLIPIELPQVARKWVALSFTNYANDQEGIEVPEARATDLKVTITMKCRPSWN
jgi:hypothetical protein